MAGQPHTIRMDSAAEQQYASLSPRGRMEVVRAFTVLALDLQAGSFEHGHQARTWEDGDVALAYTLEHDVVTVTALRLSLR